MKSCAIIGGSSLIQNPSPEQLTKFNKIANWFGTNKIHILTGACEGFPYYFGKACINVGCKVTGYCPAPNLKVHTEVIGYPTDGCTDFIFLKDITADPDTMFLERSLPMITDADVILSLGGNWGTLFELCSATINGKSIICWSEFGGISKNFINLYTTLSKENLHPYGETLLTAKTYQDVLLLLEKIHKTKD